MNNNYLDPNEILIIDNFLSESHVNTIEKLMTNNEIGFYFNSQISYETNQEKNFGFYSILCQNDYTIKHHYIFEPIIYDVFNKNNINIQHIFFGRSFITTNAEQEYDIAHIDAGHYHNVFLYYVNDTDGDTVFFDKMHDEQLKNINYFSYDESLVWKRVTPKKGRIVIFNGFRFHCSQRPAAGKYRISVNYNVI